MAQKLTKMEAAARLDVSQSTIDRMIQRGELQIEPVRNDFLRCEALIAVMLAVSSVMAQPQPSPFAPGGALGADRAVPTPGRTGPADRRSQVQQGLVPVGIRPGRAGQFMQR